MADHEQRARERKVLNFGSHLRTRGITSTQFDAMLPEEVAQHAEAAGISAPSAETVRMTSKHLKTLEKYETDDPFAGL